MRVTAIAALALLCLGLGDALANPIVVERMLVDFNPPNYQHRIDPEPGELVQAYLMVDLLPPIPEGMKSISFAVSLTPGMAGNPVFANLLDSAAGDWETGITLSTYGCIETFPAAVGRLSFVYLGVPGDVAITDHYLYPRRFVECPAGNHLYFCIHSHGGVGKPGAIGDCFTNPVEDDVTWGAIKALYTP